MCSVVWCHFYFYPSFYSSCLYFLFFFLNLFFNIFFTGKIAIPLALEFLKRWPTPQAACQAKLSDILDVIEPLGFGRTRAAIIIRFSCMSHTHIKVNSSLLFFFFCKVIFLTVCSNMVVNTSLCFS